MNKTVLSFTVVTLLLAVATTPTSATQTSLLNQTVTVNDVAATVNVQAANGNEFLILAQFQSSKFPVGCLSAYRDLQYELLDAKSHVVPVNQQSLEHQPPELSIAGHVVTGSRSHPCSGSAPGGIWAVRAFFSVLYPNLSPGKYTLRITFAPRGIGRHADFRPVPIFIEPAAAQTEDPMWAFYADTVRHTFTAGDVSGWVMYRSSYSGYAIHPLLVYISLRSTTRLYCMNYADFDFDLHLVGSPQRIANHAQVFDFGGQPVPRTEIARSPCPHGPRHDAAFPFKLDELYPDLKPGTYTLKVTFDPRDRSFPPTPLTTVTFQI